MEHLWIAITIVGPIVLLAAIIYGTVQYRKRDRRLDPVSDQAARDLRHELEDEDARKG